MKFDGWCKEGGIRLLPWQEKVSKATFLAMKNEPKCLNMATGKTFLFKLMLKFITQHGHKMHTQPDV